jgi:hypothetical protein
MTSLRVLLDEQIISTRDEAGVAHDNSACSTGSPREIWLCMGLGFRELGSTGNKDYPSIRLTSLSLRNDPPIRLFQCNNKIIVFNMA